MPNRLQIKFINDALDSPEKLNEWEDRFINDIAEYADNRELSSAQNKILNRISDKLNRNAPPLR